MNTFAAPPVAAQPELSATQQAAAKRYPTREDFQNMKEVARRALQQCEELNRELDRELIRRQTKSS